MALSESPSPSFDKLRMTWEGTNLSLRLASQRDAGPNVNIRWVYEPTKFEWESESVARREQIRSRPVPGQPAGEN